MDTVSLNTMLPMFKLYRNKHLNLNLIEVLLYYLTLIVALSGLPSIEKKPDAAPGPK